MKNMRTIGKNILLLLMGTAILLAVAPQGAAVDLTGVWDCDDGGTYYIRQLGNNVWWYGEQDPNSPGWSNVAMGTIDGSRVMLTWADVPKGGAMGSGNLVLDVVSGSKLQAVEHSGFGGSAWKMRGAPEDVPGPDIGPSYEEDCISFDPNQAEVMSAGGRWKIAVDGMWLLDFGTSKSEAESALEIIKYYGMNSQCFVGRPQASMEYYLVNGDAPVGPMIGEDAIPFDPYALEVKRVQGRWKIVEGSHLLMDFDQQEEEARQALDIILRYDFHYMCYVGRPDPSMTYFRK